MNQPSPQRIRRLLEIRLDAITFCRSISEPKSAALGKTTGATSPNIYFTPFFDTDAELDAYCAANWRTIKRDTRR